MKLLIQQNCSLTDAGKSVKTPGQLAYEEDVRRRPTYDDGSLRPTWEELYRTNPSADIVHQSWERNPTPRDFTSHTEAINAANQPLPAASSASEGLISDAPVQFLLEASATAQTAYWSALRSLESAIGRDIDDVPDFAGMTVADLMELLK